MSECCCWFLCDSTLLNLCAGSLFCCWVECLCVGVWLFERSNTESNVCVCACACVWCGLLWEFAFVRVLWCVLCGGCGHKVWMTSWGNFKKKWRWVVVCALSAEGLDRQTGWLCRVSWLMMVFFACLSHDYFFVLLRCSSQHNNTQKKTTGRTTTHNGFRPSQCLSWQNSLFPVP